VKRLMILRHAKSDWAASYGSDHGRPLNKRGKRAARAVGIAVARSGEVPDRAITSTAVRARDTLERAMDAGGWDSEVSASDALYGTSVAGALSVAAGGGGDAERLMLVGHQPTWGSLVYALTGASVVVKTATLIAVDLAAGSWADAENARGSIAYLLQPRLFTDGSWRLA
jgi:phosphohistidine phosphatase